LSLLEKHSCPQLHGQQKRRRETYFTAKPVTGIDGGTPWEDRSERLWASFIGVLSK
jgi:hypothetical protein